MCAGGMSVPVSPTLQCTCANTSSGLPFIWIPTLMKL
jgi:hypothetical protein